MPAISRRRSRHSNRTIEPERLVYIPERYWTEHEFCFYLHDQMLQLLSEYEASGAHRWVANAFQQALADSGDSDTDIDMLQVLKEHNLVQQYKHHVVGHLVLGLTSDMLHFLYEALICFEKRKFSVGFALLRKPIKENLLFLSWLLADQDDFISRFEANTYTTLNRVPEDRRLSILRGAISKLALQEVFDEGVLNAIAFSKTNLNGLEPVWQRASHLITSQGDLLRTEDLNINFIFHDPQADDMYDVLYRNLPYVLIYATQVTLECFGYILKYNEQTVSHLLIVSMGCYEVLLGMPKHITPMLSKQLRAFLKCLHCGASLRLTTANAIEMYLKEQLVCHKCELTSPFPLYWILSSAKVRIVRHNGVQPIVRTE